jgi:hypothetical protein
MGESRRRVVVRRTAVLGLAVAAMMLFTAGTASAFSLTGTRDWVQANYYKTFYSDSNNSVCTTMCSLSYRLGGGVPRVYKSNPQDDAGFYSNTSAGNDQWGPGVDLLEHSNSWTFNPSFRDHLQNHAPSGTDWTRVTLHRCSAAPAEDTRWSGGHITFYHTSVGGSPTGESSQDYFHGAVIYARHTESVYHRGWWGTCKVDRSPGAPYYGPNFINLQDRYDLMSRRRQFVQVNTLVNN